MPAPVTLVSGGVVPAAPGASRCPAGTVSTVWTSAPPASMSATEMALPLIAEKTRGVLPGAVCGPGTVLTGGSLTAVTLIWRGTMMLGVAESSVTWKLTIRAAATGFSLPLV